MIQSLYLYMGGWRVQIPFLKVIVMIKIKVYITLGTCNYSDCFKLGSIAKCHFLIASLLEVRLFGVSG